MKNITITDIRYSIFAIAITFVFSLSSLYAQSSGGGRLTGTWDTDVSIVNCADGSVINSFRSTGSFNQGGTYTGITAGTPPSVRTTEVGIWKHVAAEFYRFRFKAYLTTPGGTLTQVITHDLQLGQDNFSYVSAGTSEIYNSAGVLVASGCSTAVGTRMTLD